MTERRASPSYDVVIVGAGHNGLVAATYLGRKGLKVLVLERRGIVGGACITEEIYPGVRASTCAHISFALSGKVVDDLKLKTKYGLKIYRMNPRFFVPFKDGRHFFIWSDLEKTVRGIDKISPGDGEGYRRWSRFWGKAINILYPFFLENPPSLDRLVRKARELGSEDVLQRVLTSSMQDIVEECFVDEGIRGSMVYFSQDPGDPSAPGTAYSGAHVFCSEFCELEGNQGIVEGGMGSITQAMARAAVDAGVDIVLEAEAEEILVKGGRAKGVRLKDGRIFSSDVVVSNADPKRTFLKLIDQDALEAGFIKRVKALKTDAGCLKFICVIDGVPDFSRYLGKNFDKRLIAEALFTPSVDFVKRSWEATRTGNPLGPKMFVLNTPTSYDRTLAPRGRHVMSFYIEYVPVRPRRGRWEDYKERVAEQLLDELSEYAPRLRKQLVHWTLFTPTDIENKTYMTDGNIRHIDLLPGQLESSRPMQGWSEYRTPIEGLYLCGSATHPVGDVSGASGHNASRAIIRDLTARTVK